VRYKLVKFLILYITPMPGSDCGIPIDRSQYRYSFTNNTNYRMTHGQSLTSKNNDNYDTRNGTVLRRSP